MVTSLAVYTGLVALVGVERLVELAVSNRNVARAIALGAVEVGRGHYRAMVVMHAAFLVACVCEAWLTRAPFPGVLGWVALAGTASAQALRYWSIATLGPRWNTRVVVWPGVDPVTRGPYRLVRHPNYLAVIAEIVCLPLVHGAWRTALFFTVANAALLFVRIRVEERALGPRYAAAFEGRARFLPEVTR